MLGILAWRGTALSSALPVLLMAVTIIVILGAHDRDVTAAAPGRSGLGDYGRALRALLADRTVMGLAVMSGFRSAAQHGLLVFVPLYLAEVLQAGPFVTGLGFAAMQAGGILMGPLAGAWSDRIGRRPIVMGGLIGSTVVIALIALAGSQILFVSGVTVLGFLLLAVRPVVHGWMMDLAPPALAGATTSVVFGTQSLFSIAVPVIGGAIADAYGVTAVFPLLAGLMLISNVIVWLLPERRV
jgi:MFS family permease